MLLLPFQARRSKHSPRAIHVAQPVCPPAAPTAQPVQPPGVASASQQGPPVQQQSKFFLSLYFMQSFASRTL